MTPDDPARARSWHPQIRRGSMPTRPWLGLWRSTIAGLAGIRFDAGQRRPLPAWAAVAQRRRRLLAAGVLGFTALALGLGPAEGAGPGGGSGWLDTIATALFALLFTWVGVGFVTAGLGAWVMWRGDPHALPPPLAGGGQPIDPAARTALVMPICNEDVTTVFGGLRATCESLAATGALRLFDVYVLSDTADPERRRLEAEAFDQLRASLGVDRPPGTGGTLSIRWRERRTHRKAGNVADFCRRWGRRHRYMVVLDADSTMHGQTLVDLVRMMEAHPQVGILQTLPQAVGHDTLHARAQQFASRVTGRLFALGLSFWQMGDSHYWGHNAILRIEPFMKHCGLAPLPGRGALAGSILSHDFVEAALMRRAGLEVWLAPTLGGSWEQHPAHLVDELQRDRRWAQGNLQNARLIAEPGFSAGHRWMLAVGALSYGIAPLWLLYMAVGLAGGAGVGPLAVAGAAPAGASPLLWWATLLLLVAPRVLGVAAVWLHGESAAFGGRRRLLASALLEAAVAAATAPVRLLAHAGFVLGALSGWRLQWRSPSRQAAALPWRDAVQRLGVPGLLAAAAAVGLAAWGPLFAGTGAAGPEGRAFPSSVATLAAVGAIVLPWLLAAPLAVYGSRPRFPRLLRVPEEDRPPRPLARSWQTDDLRRALGLGPRPGPVVAAAARAPGSAAGLLPAHWTARPAAAVAIVALLVLATGLPRPAGQAVDDAAWQARLQAAAAREAENEATRLAAIGASHAAARREEAPVRWLASTRPARFIDAETRRRALDYVQGQAPGVSLDG